MPIDEFGRKITGRSDAKGPRCRGCDARHPERRSQGGDESVGHREPRSKITDAEFRRFQQDARRWDELIRCERIAGIAALTAANVDELIELARTYCPDRVEIFRRALAILGGDGQAPASDTDDRVVLIDHRAAIRRDRVYESTAGPPRRPRNGEPRVEARGSSRIECRVGGIHHPENPEVCQRDFARRAKARPDDGGWPRCCATSGRIDPAVLRHRQKHRISARRITPRVEKPP